MLVAAISKTPFQTVPSVRASGFATRPHGSKPKPPSTPEPVITFELSFDQSRVKNFKDSICYVIPFMSRPQAIIDEKFLEALEATSKDSIYMVEKKKDLQQYFTKHMYENYYTNFSAVFFGNGVKWFGILNSLNYYMNYDGYGDDLFFCGLLANISAAFGTCLSTSISERDIDYLKVCEYHKIKNICEEVD